MRKSTIWLMVALIAVAAVSVGGFTASLLKAEPWAPIGAFPDQTVLDIDLDAGTVTVQGTKCYRQTVTVVGDFWWQSEDPPGTILAVRTGSAVRDLTEDVYVDGCRTDTFVNPIPPEVLDADHIRSWRIRGEESPVADSDGTARDGLRQAWQTQPFTLD